MRIAQLVLLLGLSACSQSPAPAATTARPAEAPPAAPAPSPIATVGPSTAAPSASPPAPSEASPPAAVTPAAPSGSRLLAASEARTEVSGCLAAPPSATAGPETVSRSAPTTSPVAVTTGAHPVITYELEHACCLRGTTRVTQSGDVVSLAVALTGEPCRCKCRSKLRTELSLPPGSYTAVVTVEEASGAREAARSRFQVTAPESAPRLPKTFTVEPK